MPLIWCSISSHGFGHAAQVVPVVNELGRLVPGLKAILRTKVPQWFFEKRLTIPWELSPAEQDIGCVQRGPLEIDVRATWAEHLRFHKNWETKVKEEADAIRSAAPDLVLSDISHLAIEAGAREQVPTVGLCNLCWDQVLEPYLASDGPQRSAQLAVIDCIRAAYSRADVMVRPVPGIPMPAFKEVKNVGPIARAIGSDPRGLQAAVAASPGEPIVLVGFGGIAFESFPVKLLQDMAPYRFVLDTVNDSGSGRLLSVTSLGLPFGTLLASADIIVTKPGYSTVVEAVAHDRPVVYVRRYNFADEESLVKYLHRHGRGVELARQDFLEGRWRAALDAVQPLPPRREPPPPPTGASEAAAILADCL